MDIFEMTQMTYKMKYLDSSHDDSDSDDSESD